MKSSRLLYSLLLSMTALLAVFTPADAHGDLLLVDDSQAKAVIVHAPDAPRTVIQAVKELQRVFQLMSGAKLQAVDKPVDDGRVNIYLGRSRYTDRLKLDTTDLKYGAFRIDTGKDWIALLGADKDFSLPEPWPQSRNDYEAFYAAWDKITGEHFDSPIAHMWRKVDLTNNGTGMFEQDLDNAGTFFAVNHLLQSLGCRWYMPGDIGQIIPEMKTIRVPETSVVKHPQFGLRNLYVFGSNFFGGNDDRILWQLRLRANQGYELLGTTTNISFAHGSANVFRRDEAKAAHPEYFATHGGQPITTSLLQKDGPGVPCLVNHDLMQANVRYLRTMFDTYDLPAISIGPTDGFTYLCECDQAQAYAAPQRGWSGTLSNYAWQYMINVAKEVQKTHPDKKVHALAYSTYAKPPENVNSVPTNMIVGIAQARVHFIDPRQKQAKLELRKDWQPLLTAGQKFWQYEYYLQGWRKDAYQGVPVYFPQIIQEDLQSLKDISMGDYIELFPSPANYLNAWITSQLYWDVDADVPAMVDEFVKLFYGPAAKEMKALIDYSEANWKQIPHDKDAINKVFAMAEKARNAAGDSIYGQRVDLMIDYMQPMKKRLQELDQTRENIRVVKAHENDKALTLDGKIDDAFWQNIKPLKMSSIESPDAKPVVETEVKLGWRDDALWLAIRCHEPLMDKVNIGHTKDGDTNWFHYDGVEVMIETPRVSHYQMGLSPAAAITDLSRMGTFEYGWNSQADVKAHVGKDYYTIEVRIPAGGDDRYELEPLDGVAGDKPTHDKPWFINVGRLRLVAGERETFSLTGAGFHDKLKFLQLEAAQ